MHSIQAKKRTPLYDKIFKPQTITLANGHSIRRRRSRAPLYALLTLTAVVVSLIVTGVDLSIVFRRGHELFVILGKIFQPKWSFFPKVLGPLVDTIKMSVLGSVLE